jgi:hypothetical protein
MEDAKYEFDWTGFTETDLNRCNSEIGEQENKIYGQVLFDETNGSIKKKYIIDICYEYYDSKDQGFDLEVFKRNEDNSHGSWLGFIKDIQSAKSYKKFCRRAEDLLIKNVAKWTRSETE